MSSLWPLAVAFGIVQPASVPPGAGLPGRPPACPADDAGLVVPAGFCALLVGDSLGPVRHLAVASNGDVIAAHIRDGVILLRDADGDGRAEQRHTILAGAGGSGLLLAADAIYFATNDSVLRIPFRVGDTRPSAPVETIARGLPTDGHAAKGLVLATNGSLFVSFGSLTNSCQRQGEDRRGPYPSPNPCRELEQRAGIWRFDARRPGQTPADAKRWATGLRNPMAMAVEPSTGTLYMAVHGRDQLTENWNWPAEAGRENPAEEFGPVPEGADYGWPYCYYDPRKKEKLQNPEYGGDGVKPGNCATKTQPTIGFPAHWAPNGLTFYRGTAFPPEYRSGAFLAFHGSWNRAPAPQQGYRVVFIPFVNGKATGEWKDFVRPAGSETGIRPTGLAVGPDGSLYVSDDQNGKIWRVLPE